MKILYKDYKESNIKWAGKIPMNWHVSKIKFVTINEDGKREPISGEFRYDKRGDFPYYGATGIVDYINDYKYEGKYLLIGEDGAPFFIPNKNVAFIAEGKFWVNNHAHVLSNKSEIDLDFLCYMLNCVDYREYISGSTRDKLTKTDLSDIKIILPHIDEQAKIVQYLFNQTSIIDQLIQQKEKLIELIKDKRQAVINEVVTKGLNPGAKMKDSGIEWLGEVPEHWPIVKLKHVVDMKSGNFISAEMIEDEGLYPVFGGNGIRGYHNEFTHEGFFPLIGRQGALCGNINYANGKFWPTEHAVVVTPKKQINLYWIGELLRLMNLNQYSQASAQPGLSVEKILNLRITLPTFIEQNEIASKVESLVKNHDLTNKDLLESIDKLKEYRQSIISETVTGKIDVRNWQPNKQQLA